VFIGAVLLSWGLTAAARRVAVPAGATIRFLPVRP